MESNHKLSPGKEVDAAGSSYTKWKIRANAAASLDVPTDALITLLNGSNMTITRSGNDITFNSAPSLYEKVNKPVPGSTYTLEAADKTKWLVFEVSCTVTVPKGLLTPSLFEGEAMPGATVTFQAATGVTLRHTASISKVLSPDGVFGIRFQAIDNCILFGTDPVNYAG